jgi:hypothetical protein
MPLTHERSQKIFAGVGGGAARKYSYATFKVFKNAVMDCPRVVGFCIEKQMVPLSNTLLIFGNMILFPSFFHFLYVFLAPAPLRPESTSLFTTAWDSTLRRLSFTVSMAAVSDKLNIFFF